MSRFLPFLRSFLPVFRFFNLYDGDVRGIWREPGGAWETLPTGLRIGVWNLFHNPRGNLALWREGIFRASMDHPEDPSLRVLLGKCIRAQANESTGRSIPRGEFRIERSFPGREPHAQQVGTWEEPCE